MGTCSFYFFSPSLLSPPVSVTKMRWGVKCLLSHFSSWVTRPQKSGEWASTAHFYASPHFACPGWCLPNHLPLALLFLQWNHVYSTVTCSAYVLAAKARQGGFTPFTLVSPWSLSSQKTNRACACRQIRGWEAFDCVVLQYYVKNRQRKL